jgi:hypothetical protein
MELPVWTLDEVVMRNNHELMWSEGDEVCQRHRLWLVHPQRHLVQAGDDVLRSTMVMLHRALKIQTVTFTGQTTRVAYDADLRRALAAERIIPLTRGMSRRRHRRPTPAEGVVKTVPLETARE